MRLIAALLFAAFSLIAAPCSAKDETWTRAFTASLWQPNEHDVIKVENQTIRARIRVNAGGSAIRLHLGNDFGTMPVRIGAAQIRTADGRTAPILFSGRASARIGIGAPLVSDAVLLEIKPFEVVEISLYLPEATTLVGLHDARADPLLVSLTGDFSDSTAWQTQTSYKLRPLISGIDVLGPNLRPVIVALGDSITDVNNCPLDDALPCRWSDVLAQRLAHAELPHVVVNQGIGGNTIVHPVTGASAQARFDRDVLAIPGITHLLLFEGINDIGKSGDSGLTISELTAASRQLVARARAHGIKVVAMTLAPFEGANYYSPEKETMREAYNRWIRSEGIFDAVIDSEAVVADPASPRQLRADLQVGDNLHPNAAGQRAIGNAIPLDLFREPAAVSR